MFRIRPGGYGQTQVNTTFIKKYSAHNNVLIVANYDPGNFHANMLVGFTPEGKVKNLSFSFYRQDADDVVEDVSCTMNFMDGSQFYITLNSHDINYANTVKITDVVLVCIPAQTGHRIRH